jgi:hypothetical protein
LLHIIDKRAPTPLPLALCVSSSVDIIFPLRPVSPFVTFVFLSFFLAFFLACLLSLCLFVLYVHLRNRAPIVVIIVP